MKRFSEQFHKQAETIRLSSAERSRVRSELVTYMEYHPLPESMRTGKRGTAAETVVGQPFRAIPINWFYVRGASVALTVFMMITVPVAAEYTAPGDMLYPVKVRFTEEVRSSLTLNPYAKIEWETKRLERRIAEARLLVNEGRLTNELEAVVAEAVKEHSDNAKAQIAALRETDKDDAAIAEIAFSSALSVQAEALGKTMAMAKNAASADAAVAAEPSVLAAVMAEETSEAAVAEAAALPSLPKLMARVETETTAAFELFASVKDQASAEEIGDIERRLGDIERKVALATNPRPAAVPVEPATETEPLDTATMGVAMRALPEAATLLEATATDTPAGMEAVEEPESPLQPEAAPVEEAPAPEPTFEPVPEAEAVEILRGVMADLRKLITFMTDIDIRQTVSVDELVPITLTEEERWTAATGVATEIRSFLAENGDDFTGPMAPKLTLGRDTLVVTLDSIDVGQATGDLARAEAAAVEGKALLEDMRAKLLRGEVEAPEAEVPVADAATTETPVAE